MDSVGWRASVDRPFFFVQPFRDVLAVAFAADPDPGVFAFGPFDFAANMARRARAFSGGGWYWAAAGG
jgi:hypothetical protein